MNIEAGSDLYEKNSISIFVFSIPLGFGEGESLSQGTEAIEKHLILRPLLRRYEKRESGNRRH